MRPKFRNCRKRREEAEKKITVFQKQQADRQLPVAQRNALIQALSPFRGQKIAVVCILGNSEGCRFAETFKSIFAAAGWNTEGVNQSVYTGGHPVGIEVTINQAEAQAGRIPQAADVLIRALMAFGLAKQEAFVNPATPAGQIEFRVGTKPT